MSEHAGPRVEVIRGARAGTTFPLTGDIVTVGRGAECHIQLDPAGDLAASARHAVFLHRSGHWFLRDLDSRNGTYLNDLPVSREAELHDGDCIALGAGGPVLLFHAPAAAPATASPAGDVALTRVPAAAPAGGSRVLVGLSAVLGLVVLGAAAFLYLDRREQRAWERERGRMQVRLDSLRLESERTQGALRGQVSGLARALEGSRGQVEQLRGELARTPSKAGRGARTAIERRLEEAGSTLRRQQRAASLDFGAIQRANRRATAVIYVEYDDGTVAVATAFAVRPDGVLLTNRHAVLGSDGRRRPRRIGIQFCDSEQVFPARLLATADSSDLAAVAVENLLGGVPVVRGLNLRPDTLPAGAPVALIGFPLGGDEPASGSGGRKVVRPILGAGVLLALRPGRLEVQGYGAEGASGSPVFDGAGEVVGVLFGGTESGSGQTLYAVPAAVAARMLDALRRPGSS